MAVTPTNRLPEFITDGGIETHIIFNMGVELLHFSAFPLNDSATGRGTGAIFLSPSKCVRLTPKSGRAGEPAQRVRLVP
jgi:hypothetical protein